MGDKYTPGPWKWVDDYETTDGRYTWTLLETKEDGGIFGILGCDGEANSPQCVRPEYARLIAAAPGLLAALRGLANEVHGQLSVDEIEMREVLGNTNVNVLLDKIERARAAIAAATGGDDG